MLKIIMQAEWRPDLGEANLEWIVPCEGREMNLAAYWQQGGEVWRQRELGAFLGDDDGLLDGWGSFLEMGHMAGGAGRGAPILKNAVLYIVAVNLAGMNR